MSFFTYITKTGKSDNSSLRKLVASMRDTSEKCSYIAGHLGYTIYSLTTDSNKNIFKSMLHTKVYFYNACSKCVHSKIVTVLLFSKQLVIFPVYNRKCELFTEG